MHFTTTIDTAQQYNYTAVARFCWTRWSILSQSSCFSLRLQQGEDVSLAHWPLDVADDGAVAVVEELDHDLCTLALRAGATQHLGNLGQLHGHETLHNSDI